MTNSDLVQAGVTETPYDPSTGACEASSGVFYTQAWWEILPATETPINTWTSGTLLSDGQPAAGQPADVSAGDQITVTISLAGGVATIQLEDVTTGGTFATTQTYTGPADSTEMVQEAPTNQAECGGQCTLAPFCTEANGSCVGEVNFSNTAAVGTIDQYDEFFMNQNSQIVAQPTNLQSGQFSVDYTGPYAAPLGGQRLQPLQDVPFTGHVRFPAYMG